MKEKAEKILITSALPYANGPLHFGHIAGAYLPGDCYARFQRLMGNDVLYICGSDEHGVAITLSAELAHRTPKEHVDLFHHMIQDFFTQLEFSFDHYSRTTWPGHIPITQEFYEALDKKGLIEERRENHLYSEPEKRFLADRYVVGTCPKCGYDQARGDECQRCASSYEATDLKNPRSKLTGSPLVLKPSDHLYLRFDRFKDRLTAWIQEKKWKENVLHFAMQYLNDLKPRAITRDSEWGVPYKSPPGHAFAHLVFLPKEGEGLGTLEERLTPDFIAKCRKEAIKELYRVKMPKIDITVKMGELLPTCEHLLGLSLKPLSELGEEARLESLIQMAKVRVDEKGTVAAAATAAIGKCECAPPSPREPKPFYIDHPHVYYIVDNTCTLFQGNVLNASALVH